jgi:hypothetical protein
MCIGLETLFAVKQNYNVSALAAELIRLNELFIIGLFWGPPLLLPRVKVHHKIDLTVSKCLNG